MEHAQLQDSLDKELEELNKRLEQKEVFLYKYFLISHAFNPWNTILIVLYTG